MALTETRPETHAPPPRVAAQAPTTIDGVLGTGDHKTIGRLYIGGGVVGLIGSLVIAVVAVFQANNFDDLAADATDRLPNVWSVGRDLTMFGGLVPIMVGLAIYLVPLQVGAPSLAFARGAAASLWTWLLGAGLLILAYILNGGPGGLRRDSVVLWAGALAMMVGALVWAMICVAVTALGGRTQGMTLERVPQATWAFFVFSLVGLFSLPILMGELLLSYLRIRYLHLPIDESAQLTTVMDGVSLAPAIYWLGIPVLGMAADLIGVHAERPVKYHRAIMAAVGLFGLLTFGADVVGLGSVRELDFDNAFLVLGLIVIVLPVLAILGLVGDSIRYGVFRFRTAMVGALVSGLLLLATIVVSLLGLVEPIMGFFDSHFPDRVDMTNTLILNGTRFHEGVRALAVGSATVAAIAAIHHWSIKIWGRRLAESLGLFSVLLAAGGAALWAAGEIAAGIDDQPWLPARSTADFAEGLGAVALIGAALLAAGAVLLGVNMALSFVGTKPAGSSPNPWTGLTLEWATPSPPPTGNFPAPPIVTSATPLAGELTFADGSSAAADGEEDSDDEREAGGSSDAGEGEGE